MMSGEEGPPPEWHGTRRGLTLNGAGDGPAPTTTTA